MIPLITRETSSSFEQHAVERLGVPSIVLMENAAKGACDEILVSFPNELERIVVMGGPGKNGGDGWALSRLLATAGHPPTSYLWGTREKLPGDAKTNWEILLALGLATHELRSVDERLKESLESATLVVDALFGTGLNRPLDGPIADLIAIMNAVSAPKVSLDLPSGVDANTGQVLGIAVQARKTITFASHKRGLYQFPGAAHAGNVVLAPIGVPAPATSQTFLFEPRDVAKALPVRPRDAHKGSSGHVLIVAGSAGKTGAALLAGNGAMRAGAGLVTIASRGETPAALDQKVVELMTCDLREDEEGIESILASARRMRAAGVGPGLGTDAEGKRIAVALAVRLELPTVLDADALSAITGDMERIRHARGPRVLTPHPAEAARLLGTSVAEVQSHRYAAAGRLAERSGCVVVLKGAHTIIASPAGDLRVCRRGTQALGAAGTGDVLTGIVAALLCELDPFEAASVGVMLHALAGELASKTDRGLLASEVADAVPAALARCRETAMGS